jgi:hypothetical protein
MWRLNTDEQPGQCYEFIHREDAHPKVCPKVSREMHFQRQNIPRYRYRNPYFVGNHFSFPSVLDGYYQYQAVGSNNDHPTSANTLGGDRP